MKNIEYMKLVFNFTVLIIFVGFHGIIGWFPAYIYGCSILVDIAFFILRAKENKSQNK